MIITKLIGGLGNQMFQYALGRHLATINKARLYLDISDYHLYPDRHYALDCFALRAEIATDQILDDFRQYPHNLPLLQRLWQYNLLGQRNLTIKEPHFHFASNLIKHYHANIYLDGYWQTEKYFSSIETQIREDFQFVQPLSPRNEEIANQILNSEAVSVHVRRGDYVSNNITSQFHGVCDLGYFQRAIDLIASKVGWPTFFFFSDDIDWVESNLAISHPYFLVRHNIGYESYNDVRLMSLCKHNIIANSSFSWWGAWLNANEGKMVIAPKYWLNPDSTWYKDWKVNMDDYVPETWHKFENKI
jgi:Glycosyl transferase family 11